MLEDARRSAQGLVLAAVMNGGEYVDPEGLLREAVFEKPQQSPDGDLRRALGLSA